MKRSITFLFVWFRILQLIFKSKSDFIKGNIIIITMTPSRLYMQNQELDLELVFLVSSPSTPSSSADAPWSCELQEHQIWQNGLHTLDKEGLLLQDERCRSGCSSLPSICRLFHTFQKGTLPEPSANMFSVKLKQNAPRVDQGSSQQPDGGNLHKT